MSEDKKETLGFILLFFVIFGGMILIVFINSYQNGFKTSRQLCEENGGVYIEDLSSHNQNKCMYGMKGSDNNDK